MLYLIDNILVAEMMFCFLMLSQLVIGIPLVIILKNKGDLVRLERLSVGSNFTLFTGVLGIGYFYFKNENLSALVLSSFIIGVLTNLICSFLIYKKVSDNGNFFQFFIVQALKGIKNFRVLLISILLV